MSAFLVCKRNVVVIEEGPSSVRLLDMTVPNWAWILEVREPKDKQAVELNLDLRPLSAFALAVPSERHRQIVHINLELSQIQITVLCAREGIVGGPGDIPIVEPLNSIQQDSDVLIGFYIDSVHLVLRPCKHRESGEPPSASLFSRYSTGDRNASLAP